MSLRSTPAPYDFLAWLFAPFGGLPAGLATSTVKELR